MSNKDTIMPNIQWLRDATPYINAHRNRIFVITFGGEALKDTQFQTLINDIALLKSLGVKIILVHGARPQIEKKLKKQKINSQYTNGIRVTDNKSLSFIKEAISNTRLDIEAQLSVCLHNTPMAGSSLKVISGNFITAKPYGIHDGIDYGYTGKIRKVDTENLIQQLNAGHIVLLSPLGYSPTGEIFNLRAQEIATTVATAINADKLIFLMEGPGLLDNKRKLIRQATPEQIDKLLKRRKSLDIEMQNNLRYAIMACDDGVSRVHLLRREQNGSLLLELYTRDGVGCLINNNDYEILRSANIDDVSGILKLIMPLEKNGTLKKRSREQLELEIHQFTVIERDGKTIGCAALYIYPIDKVGELACIAVDQKYCQQQRGSTLLSAIEKQAKKAGLQELFVLTTMTTQWFQQHGFKTIDVKKLPIKKQQLYNYQRNSKILSKKIS